MKDSIQESLNKLDKLRKEKSNLEYFISGSGNFGISIDMTLFKHFGCGKHELKIEDGNTQDLIMKIIKDRLASIDLEISEMF